MDQKKLLIESSSTDKKFSTEAFVGEVISEVTEKYESFLTIGNITEVAKSILLHYNSSPGVESIQMRLRSEI